MIIAVMEQPTLICQAIEYFRTGNGTEEVDTGNIYSGFLQKCLYCIGLFKGILIEPVNETSVNTYSRVTDIADTLGLPVGRVMKFVMSPVALFGKTFNSDKKRSAP